MASFFGSSSPPRSKTKTSTNNISSPSSTGSSEFDSDAFWKSLGTKGSLMSNPAPFKKLSQQARESRKRKTKEVAVTVFATVMPDNPFDQQPYDEERILRIPNKYKFLAFHEDYRPAYCGTWSKPRSSIVTGRNPLGRDTAFLDYDVDSEAEWEEGDDEEGEDCEIDGPDDDEEEKIDGEEGDTRMYNYDDGWLAQDDEYDVEDNEEDNDEETVAMRKRKAAEAADASKKQGLTLARVCVVAPVFGGIPLVEAGSDILDCPELIAEHVDGADVRAGKELLSSHDAFDFMPCSENCLDLFPAPKSKKSKKTTDKDGSNSSPSKAQASKEMSQDDLRAFAKFVHNSTLGSKDKVIEELQTALPDITSSRAQATRKLDSIAEKRRLKYGGGVVWEVKSSVLESLNLQASDLVSFNQGIQLIML
jgi:chromatin assembly factor 1 subunit A